MINYAEFKRFFIYNMIGSLIIVALVAVISVLISDVTQTSLRVISTLSMVVIHSLISLLFIWDNEKQGTFNRLSFFINTLFILIVASFFTSIFGIWDIVSGETIGSLYQVYFILAFAALHGNILHKASGKEAHIDVTILLNYIFMAVVVIMLIPIIFLENAAKTLPDIFFRILGASAIIDGTLTILTIIFHKLHMHKHPKTENPLENNWGYGEQAPPQKRRGGLSIWVWILIIYLVIQVVIPIVLMFFGRVF